MNPLLKAARSEVLKYRRTLVRRILVVGPALVGVLYALAQISLGTRPLSWPLLLAVVFTWWTTVWVPLGSALLPALASRMERGAGSWIALRSRPVQPWMMYASKLAVVELWNLLAAVVMAASTLTVGLLLAPDPVPVSRAVMVPLLPCACSLPLMSIGLLVSEMAGMWSSVVLGVLGMIAGVLMAEGSRWIYIPWAWPIRADIPVAETHANGLPLKPGSALSDPGLIIPVIAVSITVGLMLAGFGCAWFSRREVK